MSQNKFCANCGANAEKLVETHKCPVCGQIHKTGSFCAKTGKDVYNFKQEKKEELIWQKFLKQKGIKPEEVGE